MFKKGSRLASLSSAIASGHFLFRFTTQKTFELTDAIITPNGLKKITKYTV